MQPTFETSSWHVTDPEVMDTDKYLSSANAPDMEEDVRLCIKSGARSMILDCANLTYMTGAGIRALLSIACMMQNVGGTISVRGLAGQPRDIFMASGMDSLIATIDISPDSSSFEAA